MKLRDSFITQGVDDVQFLVSVDVNSFNGIIRSNKTAAFIVDCLKEETTEKKIVDAMCSKYDADRETIAGDVSEIIAKLREIGAIEE